MNVLVIPDPDEWVQTGRPPYVIEVSEPKIEVFGKNVLYMNGQDIREWLRLNGVRLVDGVPIPEVDYVVCSW